MKSVLLGLFLTLSAAAADSYVFSFFRGNGENGVYFAVSDDGYRWTSINGDQPVLKPGYPGMLMRDPCVAQGPDGVYRMVWTSSWGKTGGTAKIGYASSTDLVHWSGQKLIPVMPDEPTAVNAWAPELIWDPARKQWIIFWATTIPGRFAPTDQETEGPERNHRIYATTTTDFVTFSPARLFFDPGFNTIDSTIFEKDGRWVMVFKDERLKPVKKNLRLAFAERAEGPYTGVTEPFTRDWVEGPTVAKIGDEYVVYFDCYRSPQHYGAMKSRDLKAWEDVTERLSFPPGTKHGTVLRVSDKTAAGLRALTH